MQVVEEISGKGRQKVLRWGCPTVYGREGTVGGTKVLEEVSEQSRGKTEIFGMVVGASSWRVYGWGGRRCCRRSKTRGVVCA